MGKNSSTTIKNECPTRSTTTSMLTMLKSIKENTSAIDIALLKLYKTNLILTKSEKDLLSKMVIFWELFNVSTNTLQGQQYATLNLAAFAREELYLRSCHTSSDPVIKYLQLI